MANEIMRWAGHAGPQEVARMGKARTVIASVLLAGAGITLAPWAPVTDLGYTGAPIGLLGGALAGAALALLVSELGWRRERHSR